MAVYNGLVCKYDDWWCWCCVPMCRLACMRICWSVCDSHTNRLFVLISVCMYIIGVIIISTPWFILFIYFPRLFFVCFTLRYYKVHYRIKVNAKNVFCMLELSNKKWRAQTHADAECVCVCQHGFNTQT